MEYWLTNQKVIKDCAANILTLEPSEDKPILVTLKELNQTRSVRQNALLFGVVYDQYSKHSGYTIKEIHKRYKRQFAVPIFVRDDKGYADMYLAVKALNDNHTKSVLSKEIVRLTSTTKFNTKQMSEFIDSVVKDLANNGFNVILTSDELGLFNA